MCCVCSIYPSAEQEAQMHMPIGNNTGSLPDLTILQFPSPLTQPLDMEEQVHTTLYLALR